MSRREQPSICRICKENCGILVEENGHGMKIRGNPEHTVSKGFICLRGKHYDEVHNSPERLTHPLLRRGAGWEKISYGDALELLASSLQRSKERYGPQSVVFYKGEILKHQETAYYLRHLAYGFGSPNYITVGSLCYHALALGFGLTIGGIPASPLGRMKAALIWGANPAISLQRSWHQIKKALREGAKLIVVDPTRTRTAAMADLHLRITPGSDGFLALAFLKYAAERVLLRPSFPQNGWEDLKSSLRSYRFDELLRKTGISQSLFFQTCSLLFSNLPGWIQAGLGLELQPNGLQTIRTIASLQTLLDPENRPTPSAARLRPLPGQDRYPERLEPVGRAQAPVFTDEVNEGQGMYLPQAILGDNPYPVRSMLALGANPALTFPESALFRKTFESLDFLAVFDLFMTPTARCANLVLPASNFLESLDLHDYAPSGHPCLGLVRPVVQDSKGWSSWKLIFELARALGLEAFFPWKDSEEALRYRLSTSGMALEELLASPASSVAYQPPDGSTHSWNTPDGKVHYRSSLLDASGYQGLPAVDAFGLPADIDQLFPFWLSTGDRLPYFQHSQLRESQSCRAAMPRPCLDIHPDAASSHGIENGDRVTLSTRNGKVEVFAKFDKDLSPDCLRLSHGWADVNANELTGCGELDPISGFPWMRALPARVEKSSPENTLSRNEQGQRR